MKKPIFALTALLCSFSFANAQIDATTAKEEPIKTYFITVQGGPTFSINENGAQYFNQDVATDLIDWVQGGISAGKYFSNRYGGRIALEYSNNHSACNTNETSSYGFYPYTFRDMSLFADWIINGGYVMTPKKFNWRPYFGVGTAYSFGFTESGHPWQGVTKSNFCLAFRYGLILEYTFAEKVGIFVDGTHEWYSDNFNGMCPREKANSMWKFGSGHHLGFPFDMKLNANFGLAFHF